MGWMSSSSLYKCLILLPPSMAALTLAQFAPAWGVPSVHPHCIHVHTLVQFAGVHVNLDNSGNTRRAPHGQLPVLCVDGGEVISLSGIPSFIRDTYIDLDARLDTRQRSEAAGFALLVGEELFDAMLFNWFLDEENWVQVTRKAFVRALPFPQGWWVPTRMRADIQQRLKARGLTCKKEVYRRARERYSALSQRLGKSTFFYGSAPTTLDALVFGHLAAQLHAPMVHNELQMLLVEFPNLVRYVSHILTRYFHDLPRPAPLPQPLASVAPESDSHEGGTPPTKQMTSDERIFQRRRREFLIAMAASACVGLLYWIEQTVTLTDRGLLFEMRM